MNRLNANFVVHLWLPRTFKSKYCFVFNPEEVAFLPSFIRLFTLLVWRSSNHYHDSRPLLEQPTGPATLSLQPISSLTQRSLIDTAFLRGGTLVSNQCDMVATTPLLKQSIAMITASTDPHHMAFSPRTCWSAMRRASLWFLLPNFGTLFLRTFKLSTNSCNHLRNLAH